MYSREYVGLVYVVKGKKIEQNERYHHYNCTVFSIQICITDSNKRRKIGYSESSRDESVFVCVRWLCIYEGICQ